MSQHDPKLRQVFSGRTSVPIGELAHILAARESLSRKGTGQAEAIGEFLRIDLVRRLGDDFARATSWEDLLHRLARKGYLAKEDETGFSLYRMPKAMRLCSVADLGIDMIDLRERIGRG